MAKQVEELAQTYSVINPDGRILNSESSNGQRDEDNCCTTHYQKGDRVNVFSTTDGRWIEGQVAGVQEGYVTIEYEAETGLCRKKVQTTSTIICPFQFDPNHNFTSEEEARTTLEDFVIRFPAGRFGHIPQVMVLEHKGYNSLTSKCDMRRHNAFSLAYKPCLPGPMKSVDSVVQDFLDGLMDKSEAVREVVVKLISDIAVYMKDNTVMENTILLLFQIVVEEGRRIRESALDAIAQVAYNSKNNELMKRALLTLVRVAKQDRHLCVREAALRAIPVAVVDSTDSDVIAMAVFGLNSMSCQSFGHNVGKVAALMLAEVAVRTLDNKWVQVAGHSMEVILDKCNEFVFSVVHNEMVLDAIAHLALWEKKLERRNIVMRTLQSLYRKASNLKCVAAGAVLRRIVRVAVETKTSEVLQQEFVILGEESKVAAEQQMNKMIRQTFLMLDEKFNNFTYESREWVCELIEVAFISKDMESLEKASRTVSTIFADPKNEFEVKAVAKAAVNSGKRQLMKDAFQSLEKKTSDRRSCVRQACVRAIAALAVNSKVMIADILKPDGCAPTDHDKDGIDEDTELMRKAVVTLKKMLTAKDETKATRAVVRSALALLNSGPSYAPYKGLVFRIPPSIFD